MGAAPEEGLRGGGALVLSLRGKARRKQDSHRLVLSNLVTVLPKHSLFVSTPAPPPAAGSGVGPRRRSRERAECGGVR